MQTVTQIATVAANRLQSQRLVSTRRGRIAILDRAGLEAMSCECYEAAKAEYDRVLGD